MTGSGGPAVGGAGRTERGGGDAAPGGAGPVRVIAIDGPAGSGKTTVAKALAEHLGWEYLSTGSMYRAVALAVLRSGGDPRDAAFAAAVARTARIRVEGDRVAVDGVDVTAEARSPAVDRAVSRVAAVAGVRSALVEAQRTWARRRGGGVVEGRDIGTVVFPDAILKVYLTVEADEAARRRALQEDAARSADRPDGRPARAAPRPVDEIAAELNRRNFIDSTREIDPLPDVEAAAENTVVVDTTGRTRERTVSLIVSRLRSAWPGAAAIPPIPAPPSAPANPLTRHEPAAAPDAAPPHDRRPRAAAGDDTRTR